MRIYRENNHDIMFEDWRTCNNFKAKGPQQNERTCTQYRANKQRTVLDDDDDDHDHKRRNTYTAEEDKPLHIMIMALRFKQKPGNKPTITNWSLTITTSTSRHT
eukprot:3384082-Heterocapsa_arctica.AAC.1